MVLLLISSCSTYLPLKTRRDDNQPKPIESVNADKPKKEIENSSNLTSLPPPISVEHKDEIKITNLELQKFAYELGIDPKKELKDEEKKQIVNRKKVRELERGLDSQKERLQYSKVLPWLKNDQEKIDLLLIPSIEGRQAWINKNRIWSRAKNLKEYDEVIESQDIAIGMPAEYVKKSWGEPINIETSGNPIYKNERWQYHKQISTPQGYKQENRFVFFEGGRVVGWETE